MPDPDLLNKIECPEYIAQLFRDDSDDAIVELSKWSLTLNLKLGDYVETPDSPKVMDRFYAKKHEGN